MSYDMIFSESALCRAAPQCGRSIVFLHFGCTMVHPYSENVINRYVVHVTIDEQLYRPEADNSLFYLLFIISIATFLASWSVAT